MTDQPPEYPWKEVLAEAIKRADDLATDYAPGDPIDRLMIVLGLMQLESLATIIAIELQRAELAAAVMMTERQRGGEKPPRVFDPRKGRQ
jgi:hypothetical protein